MTPTTADGLWIVVVSTIVLLLWIPHSYFAVRKWRQARDARSFRNAFIGVMIVLALTRGLLSSFSRAFPAVAWLQEVNRATAPIILALLVVGAIVATYTWLRGPPQARA